MTPVYENVFISTFIYSLGLKAGDKWGLQHHSASFNLYQQAPPDEIIGDFFANIRGKNFIIEFKKSFQGLKDELEKPQRKQLFQELECSHKLELADQCHFLSYGYSRNGMSHPDLAFLPYSRLKYSNPLKGTMRTTLQPKSKKMTAEARRSWELENINPGFDREAVKAEWNRLGLHTGTPAEKRSRVKFFPCWNMNAFQEEILRDQIGLEGAEFSRYLQILRACVGGNKGARGIAGVVLNFSKEYGVLMHKFERIEHLLTQTLDSAGSDQNNQGQKWNRGPSMSM